MKRIHKTTKVIQKYKLLFELLLIGLVFLFAIHGYVIQSAKDHIYTADNVKKADAILVLGALVYSDGQVCDMLKDRLDMAAKLYEMGKANKIIVSGDHGREEYDEVYSMKEYLLNLGIPRENILMDHAGFNTYDSMYRAKSIFKVDNLIVTTQEYHVSRAVFIGNALGMKTFGVSSIDSYVFSGMKYYEAREVLARIKDWGFSTILKKNPKYLGEEIPYWVNGILTEDKKAQKAFKNY